ncbi:MAG TPA: hypothetical protein VNA13_01605 [Xanthomonadales bacterium]|nr:hypothetical protein [Xanthomonadales bacterium]
MAGKEGLQQENKGAVEQYKGLNKLTRNIALGVAGGAAVVGAGFLVMPALLWAGGDQVQIKAIDKYQNWRKEKKANKLAKSGKIYP